MLTKSQSEGIICNWKSSILETKTHDLESMNSYAILRTIREDLDGTSKSVWFEIFYYFDK